MFWFSIAMVGYTCLGSVYVLDKFILTKSVEKSVLYTFYSTIFMFGVILLLPFGVGFLNGIDWLWAVISGITFGLALWAMYTAVKIGEASHINPFIGAITAVATYAVSSIFLGEFLTENQIVGVVILIVASLFLSFEKTENSTGFHFGFVWAILAGVFFAISHVSAKYLYGQYSFLDACVWTRFFTGFVGIFLLLYPVVRKSFVKKKKKLTVCR